MIVKAVPVRLAGAKWIMTDDHRAQAWTVGIFRRGEPVKLSPSRFNRKALAEAFAQVFTNQVRDAFDTYRLGSRMPKRTRPIIAGSR